MPAIDELSNTAKIAYQAFIDMTASKTAHINYLQALETAYEAGGAPSTEENAELEKLLANHDKNVIAFKTAMSAVDNSDEKFTLVKLMS